MIIRDEISELKINLLANIDNDMPLPALIKRIDVSYAHLIRLIHMFQDKGFITVNKVGRTNYLYLELKGYEMKSVCQAIIGLWDVKK